MGSGTVAVAMEMQSLRPYHLTRLMSDEEWSFVVPHLIPMRPGTGNGVKCWTASLWATTNRATSRAIPLSGRLLWPQAARACTFMAV